MLLRQEAASKIHCETASCFYRLINNNDKIPEFTVMREGNCKVGSIAHKAFSEPIPYGWVQRVWGNQRLVKQSENRFKFFSTGIESDSRRKQWPSGCAAIRSGSLALSYYVLLNCSLRFTISMTIAVYNIFWTGIIQRFEHLWTLLLAYLIPDFSSELPAKSNDCTPHRSLTPGLVTTTTITTAVIITHL